jgi:hypothetical protein
MGSLFNPAGMGGHSLGKAKRPKFHGIVGTVADQRRKLFFIINSAGYKLYVFSFRKHSDCHFQIPNNLTTSLTRNSQMDFLSGPLFALQVPVLLVSRNSNQQETMGQRGNNFPISTQSLRGPKHNGRAFSGRLSEFTAGVPSLYLINPYRRLRADIRARGWRLKLLLDQESDEELLCVSAFVDS